MYVHSAIIQSTRSGRSQASKNPDQQARLTWSPSSDNVEFERAGRNLILNEKSTAARCFGSAKPEEDKVQLYGANAWSRGRAGAEGNSGSVTMVKTTNMNHFTWVWRVRNAGIVLPGGSGSGFVSEVAGKLLTRGSVI